MPDLIFIGIVIILAGFLLVFLAMVTSGRESQQGKETRVRGGGVILIGPIPIVFGSDARWASVALILAIVLIVIVLFSGVLIRQ